MKKWATAAAVLVGLAGAGLLVYWQWDSIWAFVFSPIGGLVAKIVFSAKVLKVVAGAVFAVGAGWVAVRKKLRRGTPEPQQQVAPPVYGPPEEVPEEGPAPGHTEVPPAQGHAEVPAQGYAEGHAPAESARPAQEPAQSPRR